MKIEELIAARLAHCRDAATKYTDYRQNEASRGFSATVEHLVLREAVSNGIVSQCVSTGVVDVCPTDGALVHHVRSTAIISY